jgi:hypothetical protein
MKSHTWHRQAFAAPIAQPEPLSEHLESTPTDRTTFRLALEGHLRSQFFEFGQTLQVQARLEYALKANSDAPPGSKTILCLDGMNTLGKSTLSKRWGMRKYVEWVGQASPDRLPRWNPLGRVDADFVPVVYATLQSTSAIKELNAQLLTFMGYGTEGVARATTTRVVEAFEKHGARLVILDDLHFLRDRSAWARQVLDYLKFLNSELGELGGTLFLIGAELDQTSLYTDPQIAGRLRVFRLVPFGIGTAEQRAEWQRFLCQAEDAVLPYLPNARDGILSRTHAAYIWRRTQGFMRDVTELIREATLQAATDGTGVITREHLDAVALSVRAQSAEAELISGRRVVDAQ